jgi:hypothetical protein
MKMPNFGDAHCGEGAPQSQHRSLEDVFWISRSCFSVSKAGETIGGEDGGEDL